MSSRILDYSKWKKIHESKQINEGLFWDVTETEPIGGTNHKVKVKYVDGNSIKVKAVNDRDLVGENGAVSQDLMDNIVIFLNGHDKTNFSREYPALQNMATFYKDNFFTVNVKKENDRRQVVVFTIQKRANFKGVTPETKILTDDAAAKLTQAPEAQTLLANSDKNLLQNTAQTDTKTDTKTAAGPLKLAAPIAIADIVNYTADSPFFKIFDDAVAAMATSKVFTDKRATDLIGKVADELEAKKIGENSIKLVKGLMAGFGATTFVDKYGRTKEQTQINQDFINKIAALVPKAPTAQNSSRNYYLGLNGKMIFEQTEAPAFALPADFKMEEFIKAISAGAPGELTTGDIKLPEGGIKKGTVAKGDAELKKVQQLIIDKLGVVLAKDPVFIKFKGYGADGDYGTTTEKIVAMAKAGFELKDTDGTTITAELINKLLTDKITESYIGLDGKLFEKFNVEAATKTSSSYVPSKSTKKDATKKDATSDRQKNINKVYCSVQDGIIKLEGSTQKGTKWEDYVKTYKVTDAEIEAAKKSCSTADTKEKKSDAAGTNIDLNKISKVTIKTPNNFVVALIQTAIDVLGKDWSSAHTDWMINSLTSLNALGGKFPATTLQYKPDSYSIWKDIFSAYISPLSGGDAPLKNQIAKTGLKAVGSAKSDKDINIILSAINTKNNESIISDADEKSLCGAFMLISPTVGSLKLESLAKGLGYDDSGIFTAWGEMDQPTYSHCRNLAVWAVGALGYLPEQFKGLPLDAAEIKSLKDSIKSSLTK